MADLAIIALVLLAIVGIGLLIAFPLVRALRRSWTPSLLREIVVAVVRGVLAGPSVIAAGHGILPVNTLIAVLFYLKEPQHFHPNLLIPSAVIAILSLALSARLLSKDDSKLAVGVAVRLGIWLPIMVWAIAVVVRMAVHPNDQTGAGLKDDFASLESLLQGVSGSLAFFVVLATSIACLQLLRHSQASRAESTSIIAGLVISVAFFGALVIEGPIASHIAFERQNRMDLDRAPLVQAVHDRDLAAFSQALLTRQHFKLDSPEAYRLLFFTIEKREKEMGAELLKAGMPVLKDGELHPDFRQELFASRVSIDPAMVAAHVMDVAKVAEYPQKEELDAAMKRAIDVRIAEDQRSRRHAATLESMAEEIQNDPKLGFAASLSPEDLRVAAQENRFPPLGARNSRGETILFFALRDEHQCDRAPELIRAGIDVHGVNHLKVTPLMLAAGNCKNETLSMLLERKADIQARSFDGSTALMYASVAGQSDNVRRLLAAGAYVNARTDKGETALGMARQQGFDDVVKMLEQARR